MPVKAGGASGLGQRALAGETVEDFAGAGEMGELFFFGAEFGRVRDERAAGAARRMFDVEHFVVEDVLDGALRDVGAIHAAIDRFTDATVAKPGYAVPFKYLGEAQEKKGQKKPAAKSYQRYLDLYPKAEDAEKIRKRIEKLYKETEKEKNDIR